MHAQAPNVLFPATNIMTQRWYNRAACGWCGSHYRTNELSPWQSDLSANEASRARAGGSMVQGQPGDHLLREATTRHLTPGELVKLPFPDNMLAGVEEANHPYTVSTTAEWLSSITVTYILAGVYRWVIQKKANEIANVSLQSSCTLKHC